MSPLSSSIVITLGTVALYFAIRAAPVQQCEFVHYRDYMGADGAIEECGVGETTFFDLSEYRYPIVMKLQPKEPLKAGQATTVTLHLTNSQGSPITPDEIAISHTQKLHLLLIDSTLEDYIHVHPAPAGGVGVYSFTFTPQSTGIYQSYLDFIALKSGRRVLASGELLVAPPDGESPTSIAPKKDHENLTFVEGEMIYNLVPEAEGFRLGQENRFRLKAESTGGELIYETVMGAYAHVVAFKDGVNGFAHLHPTNPFVSQQDPRNPDLGFVFAPTESGRYRLWTQLKINGHEKYIPFDIKL